jgi:hypothetical protein
VMDGSQSRAGPRADDATDGREWIPREISDGPSSVYQRRRRVPDGSAIQPTRRVSEPTPFDRSRSRLRDALGNLSGPETEGSFEQRLRRAKERASELDRRIREVEMRVSQALGAVDQIAAEEKRRLSDESETPK